MKPPIADGQPAGAPPEGCVVVAPPEGCVAVGVVAGVVVVVAGAVVVVAGTVVVAAAVVVGAIVCDVSGDGTTVALLSWASSEPQAAIASASAKPRGSARRLARVDIRRDASERPRGTPLRNRWHPLRA